MQPSIRLGFIGSYKWDFIHYLASIYTVLGKKVAVVDASCEQLLAYSLPEAVDESVVTWRNTDFYFGRRAFTDEDENGENGYDIVLTDYGLDSKGIGDMQDVTLIFLVTDLQRHHLSRLNEIFKEAPVGTSIVKIYRDLTPGPINSRYADRILQLDDRIRIVAQYFLEHHERDSSIRIWGQYEGFRHFKGISADYLAMLSDIVEETMQLPLSSVKKAVKSAQGGRLCR